MKQLNAKDSIYLVRDEEITHSTQIVHEYPHYSVLLRKNAGGLVFLWRLTFDTFHYLDQPSQKLLIDSYKILDNPLTSFIHQLLTRNEQLKTFKTVYKPDDGLKLLLSILLTKQITHHSQLFSMYEESRYNIVQAYRSEEAHHLATHVSQNRISKTMKSKNKY